MNISTLRRFVVFLLLFQAILPNLLAQPVLETISFREQIPIDVADYRKAVLGVPLAKTLPAAQSNYFITLPYAANRTMVFRVAESPIMAKSFAKTYPGIKTYALVSLENPSITGRMTISDYGLNVTLVTPNGLMTIKPEHMAFTKNHILSMGAQFDPALLETLTCNEGNEVDLSNPKKSSQFGRGAGPSNGETIRNYIVAVVTTGEFHDANGGTVPAATTVVVSSMNGIQAIYERELAVTFEVLTPHIYTDYTTDPFLPGLDRPAKAVEAVIANFNSDDFDIGHVFHDQDQAPAELPGGGVAGLGVVCSNDMDFFAGGPNKAAGWSGSFENASEGWISLATHEFAHMFNAPHTFNGTGGSCTANISSTTSYEIASGTTIMSYNGICGVGQNIPSGGEDDHYFHANSLELMIDYLENDATCASTSSSGNTPPVVDANPCGGSDTIPVNTAFKLVGEATDADGDPIYYCWEQYDEDGVGTPTQGFIGATAGASTIAPLFRSYPPTLEPTKYYPDLSLIVANSYNSSFEPLPTVGRTLNFRLTARDWNASGGGIDMDPLAVTVSASGPLAVTAPNGAENLTAGSATTVTWNVNGTDGFCTNVNIRLSVDGGYTYPYLLLENTANDGSQSVTLPEGVPETDNARIYVECANNPCVVFFDISNANFNISSDCVTEVSAICPTEPEIFDEGDAGLDLNLEHYFGGVITQNTFSITNASPVGPLANATVMDGTTCQTAWGNEKYDTLDFAVSETGSYTFVNTSGGQIIYSVFLANGYNPASPCAGTFIGSNAWSAISWSTTRTLTLTACTEYKIVVWTLSNANATPTITISGPADIFLSNAGPGVDYSYTFVAINTANDQVAAVSATSDFTALGAGNYEVYGVSYYSGGGPNPPTVDPTTWIGETFEDILSAGDCALLSVNKKLLTINAGATPEISIAATDATKNEGNAGNTAFTFTATRTGDLSAASSVDWAVTGSGGNPANATDFGGVLPSGTANFAINEASQVITVNVSGDMDVESDEGFTVTISNPVNATIGTATATGTILNDDALPPPVISIAATDATKNEGNAGNTAFTFTATRTGDLSAASSVDWAVTGSGGNPANATDFGGVLPSGIANFAINEASQVITVNVSGDMDVESDEGFTVTISNPVNATIGTATATGTILNDDALPPPVISIAATDATKNEGNAGNTAFTFTATRTGDLSAASSVDWAVTGSGGNPANATDFGGVLPSGTANFAINEASQVITVNVSGDMDVESDEGFTVTISNPVNATIGTATATGTILNDDALPPPVISIVATDATKNEGNAGNTAFTFTATRTGDLSAASSVDWAVTGSGGNPANATDFGGVLPSGTANFAINEASQVITVNVSGDMDVESDEGFTVTISNPVNATIGTATATGTILNDDALPPPVISIVATDATKNEGNAGNTAFTFTATRTGDLSAASSVDWAVTGSGGNPANATDFGGVLPSGTANFAINEASQVITVNVSGDMDVESDEGFTVTISNPVNATIGTATATGTILNDDALPPPVISIVATDATKNEGNAGNTAFTFTATRTGDLSAASSVDWAVTGSGGNPANATDFGGVLPSGTANFAINSSSQVITVNVSGDMVVESDEGFTVTISNPVNATIGTATAVGSILNDDAAPVCPTVSQVFINEFHYDNSGADVGEFVEVAVANAWGGNVSDITLTLYNGSGGVTYGTHGLSTFTTGANDGTFTYYHKLISGIQNGAPDGFSLHCQSNAAFQYISYEGAFTATNGPANGQTSTDIGASQNGTDEPAGSSIQLVSGTWYSICGQNTQGAQNALPTVAIVANDAVKNEGNAGNTSFTFTLTRSGLTTGSTTVNYTVTGSGGNPANTTDFGGSFPSGTVTFAVAETTKDITINVSGDLDVESDEGFTVTMTSSGNCYVNLATPSASGTILNDDALPLPEISIAATDATKNEGNAGNTAFTFTATRTGDLSAASSVDWAVTGSGGNPANATDFGGVLPSGTANFAINEASQVITVNVSGDMDVESDEGFTVTISNPVNATIGTAIATGTILNDDALPPPVISIAATDATKNEGNAGNTAFTFTATRTGDLSAASSVDWAVTGSGGNPANATDFGGVLPSGTANFAINEASQVITVNVSGDMDVESDEGFTVTISNPVNATIGTAIATGTILNDDALPPPVISIAATDATKNEGNAGNTAFTFTATRTGDLSAASSIDWAVTGSGGNPSNAADFGGVLPSGTANFAMNESSQVITINVSGDLDVESDEGFTVTISNPVNATIGTATAIGSILNDDVAPTCTKLYFSEYVEGSSNNKAVEIYNPGTTTVTLTGNYQVRVYFNGSGSPASTISLVGSIAPKDVFILVNSSAGASLLPLADQTSGALTFNGDDAVELYHNSATTTLDVIGQIGFDPGAEWGAGLQSTADNTIRRKFAITEGDPNGANVFAPSVEWDGYAQDDFTGIGSHASACACDLTDAGLTDVHCEDNNETPDTDDDYIWFQLNPMGSGLGTGYDVSVDMGTVLLDGVNPATNVPYGGSNFFRLQAGSAGAGNVVVTITDVPTGMSCTIDVVVEDPGTCSDVTICDAYFEYSGVVSNTDMPYDTLLLCETDPEQFPSNYINGGTFSSSPAGLDINNCTGAILPANSTPGVYAVAYSIAPVWINEIHYDNVGVDVNEFIEVAGQEGTDLSNYSIILYDGLTGLSYQTIPLTGVIDDEGSGFGAVAFSIPGIEDGAPDGIALVQCDFNVVEYFAYEGSFQALNGPAAGYIFDDMGVSQDPAPASGITLQREGLGCSGSDFNWVGPLAETEGSLNASQTITPDCFCSQFINMVIEALPNAGIGSNTQICDNDPAIDLFDQLTGEDMGGTWNDDDNSGGLSGSMFDPSIPGQGVYQFTYTVAGNACPSDNETVTITVDGCANYTIVISDPCSCNNDATPNNQDGTFGEEVTIMGPPNLNLVVGNGSVGLIGVSIGDAIPEIPVGSGIYILLFDHLDATGYSLQVALDNPANLLGLSVANTCYYPIASINGLATTYCEGDLSVSLSGSANLGNGGGPANGVGAFFVNGVGPVTMFDPTSPGVFTIRYEFDAADNDPNPSHPGCISIVAQDVTVNDSPVLTETHVDVTCPVGNDGSIDISVTGGTAPLTFDWADLPGTNNGEDRSGLSAGLYDVTVTDDNGCSDNLSVTILDGVDGIDPDITCPDDITIECDDSTDPADTGMASATDDCDPDPAITYTDVEDLTSCGGTTGTITRTWRAEDASGNFVECDQIITVNDTTPPVWITTPLPQDVTVECDAIPVAADLEASDNCVGGAGGNVIFINELHYDNTGADVNEFVEVAGTAGLDLTGYSIVWYNGSNGTTYGTTNLSGVIDDEGNMTGARSFTFVGIQNGSPDALALVDPANNVLQFLSYEGAFMATNGPAIGMMSVDIGVAENGAEPIGNSLQLTGTGSDYADFVWNSPAPESPGSLNTNQTLDAPAGGPVVNVVFNQVLTPGACTDSYTITRTWTATDACNNAITHTQEITVEDITDPTWTSNLPGDVSVECDMVPAAAVLTADDNCDLNVTVSFDEDRADGNCPHNYVLTRIWTATDNCNNAITHTQTITVSDTTPPVWDQNPLPQDVTVACNMVPDAPVLTATDNCTDGGMGADVLFINEIHYDNTGGDVNEFIEIAGAAGLNLTGYSLVLYNGSNGLVYNTLPLTGTIPNEGNGTGALAFVYPVNGIQNGSPDGIALVQGANVLYFLSYEGAFLAVDGPAAGIMSVDIGVAENGAEPIGQSLQLIGTGTDYPNFTWTGPLAESPGLLNVNQDFTLPVPTEIVYTFNENFAQGACLGEGVYTRTWTATDACNNTITHTQTITVIDDIPPVFNEIPQDLTVECDAIPSPLTVEAVDGCGPVAGIRPWINEIHYDNVGVDVNEFFEIAGPAGIDLGSYTIYLYNGANGLLYGNNPLSGVIPDEGTGYGALAFFLPVNGIQNGSPDGIALYQGATLVQFLSYEGAFVAVDGPAAGQGSVNIGVAQEPAPAIGLSLQLAGTGNQYNQFTWTGPVDDSPGLLNSEQLAGPVEVPVVLTENIIPGNCIGRQTISRTFRATDDCGNTATVTQTITVVDTTPPVAQCKDATLFLDDNGLAVLNPADIDNGSTDNCSPVLLSLSKTTFTCSDKGMQNVTLTVSDDCGNSAACVAVVTVLDLIPPTITCPPSRIINLDPGLCCAIVSWAEPTVTDNCPFVGPVTGLFTANAGAPGNFFNAFAGVTFDVRNDGAQPLTISSWDIPVTGTLGNNLVVNVYYTTVATTNVGVQTNPAAWTLLGSANVPLSVNATPWNPATLVNIPVGGLTLNPGQSKGIYVVITNYPSGTLRYTNGNFTQTDGTLSILSNGFAGAVNFGNTFASRAFVGRVNYQTGGEPDIIQTGGPISGTELCKDDSPWEVSYRVEDSSGNEAECSFTISVLEYAFPISNLQCNDNIQVSLDEDCNTPIGADMILEGGPYGCYDDYVVMVFNAQNQVLPTSPFVGRQQIGGTFKVKVTDPETGNSCWGQISVEDKRPPVMECRDIVVDCGADIPLEPAPALTGPQSIIYSGLNEPIGEAGAPVPDIHEYSFDFSYLPAGTPVQDVDIRVKLTGHTWLPDLDIRVISPNGTESDIFSLTGCTGTEWPIDVIFDDQGQNNLTQCAELNAAGARLQPILAPGQSGIALDVFNGEDASGIWRIRFADNVGLDDGVIEIAGVILTADVPAVPVTDNCDPVITLGDGLDYGDDLFNYTCAQDADYSQLIVRTWTAVDDWGNSTQCTQEIRVRRPTITSVILPHNYDDLDLASFNCKSEYPLPDVTGQPDGAGCGSLQFAYEDKVLEICQGSYTILRTWTLHDMCTNDISSHTQVIKVTDKTPPVLTCPDIHDIKIGATKKIGYQECTAEVQMPWIQVTDDCSTTNNLTFYVWTTLADGSIVIVNTMNAEGYFIFDLPVGRTYTFTYTAIDHCGNKAECTIPVLVNDNVPPVVICETLHIVALSDSVTLVNAVSFDDGSYDGCSNVIFDARRGTMNSSGAFVQHPCNLPGDLLYAPQVRFYCCDGLSNVPLFVDLRVRDAFGNANNCMVEVQVVDKVRPVIWCPDDITVQCGMPFTPTETDTFEICTQPGIPIKAAYAATYTVPIDIFGIPADAKITDLDLKLDIDHDLVNQLQITLYSPLNRKATVLTKNGCVGQPVQYPWGIDVLFNDQAYDINIFNSTNQKVAALFACTTAKPSIGAYNQGHMKPQGDELKVFNGQPLNSFTDKNLCFTAGQNDIDAVTNRISNFSVQQFILQAGLVTGDRILLEYSNATGAELTGIHVGSIYIFQVINNNTIEFLTITGSDITSVPAGSAHMFCASGTWLLVVEDTAPLAGGLINEVCMSIEYALPLGLKPHVTDNAQECGLDVSYQDLATPDKCADGTFINRRWRVDDAFGNNTSCIQRVYFTDESPLTVQFPCDVTIQCQDLEDLEETGDVRHNGDCELVGVEHIDHTLVTTDACFKILRTWIVKDWCQYQDDGTVDYPTTNINDATEEVTFTTAINALITSRKIDIGDRVTLRYVTSGSVEIPGLVEGDVYSVIRVSGTTFRFDYNTTKQQSVNITGQGTGPHIFRFANSEHGLPVTCDVLEEWYPFTEWYTGCCNPAAERRAWENDGDGYFKFTQEIKVVDNTAPQWVDCADREFCSFEENCEPTLVELIYQATDNCTDTSQLSYTYFIDLFNDGTVDISGAGNDASGAYPNGTHQIVFKVTDQCGNWNTCTSLFTIRDCKKPTPICINGLSVDLMPSTGFVEVWASSFEAGDSYDNCTEYEKLTIKIERLDAVDPGQTAPDADAGDTVKVSCLDMPPNKPLPIVKVAIWVGDEAGNWDYCVTELWVQDWMGPCAATMNTELVAYVANEDQEPVEKVAIDLTGSMNMPALITGSGGNVSFGTVPVEGQYTVTPQKDIQPLNGVSTYDLLLIQKHLLGIKSISSTYKLIAADANNSCSVSISDIIELRKMILTPGLNFKDNTSWRFVEANYVFPNPTKPCDFPEVKNFNNLNPGMTSANFIGVKIGDVSGDAVPNSLLGADTRNSVGVLAFAIADQVLVGGEEYTIAITADHFQGVQGYQYTIDFDASVVSFDRVDAVWTELSSSNFGTARVNEGLLTTSWNGSEAITLADGEVLFTVTFRAKANVKLSRVMNVNSRVTAAEAYDAREDLLDVKFRFNGDLVVGGQFELYQNEPNPFRDVTIIGFNLPEASRATLKLYDVTGKVVKVVRGDFAKGYNSINLDRTDIQGNGMLYYQLDTPTDSATKRMILID